MPIRLTPEELNLVRRVASDKSPIRRIFFFVPTCLPPVIVAVGGWVKQDYFMLGIAFLALLVPTLWLVYSTLISASILSSISSKILDDPPSSGA